MFFWRLIHGGGDIEWSGQMQALKVQGLFFPQFSFTQLPLHNAFFMEILYSDIYTHICSDYTHMHVHTHIYV